MATEWWFHIAAVGLTLVAGAVLLPILWKAFKE